MISIHQSHSKVKNNRNKIALSRGPLVYCFESIDNPNSNIPDATIDLDSPITAIYSDILNGIWTIKCKDLSENRLTAIPYYSWGNRDPSKVQVWIRKD
ncbi:MAG: hypothetical protein KAS63_03165 [Candidatus Heimdallarchaeota archaeon]|nr:hypothetical protein [Candidatus Heimdallarchaeota archaeon]MCK4954337.1 hypothetical protein [Candidatus Heimdallarchaeota archaeon]